jgi:hypothetical protein
LTKPKIPYILGQREYQANVSIFYFQGKKSPVSLEFVQVFYIFSLFFIFFFKNQIWIWKIDEFWTKKSDFLTIGRTSEGTSLPTISIIYILPDYMLQHAFHEINCHTVPRKTNEHPPLTEVYRQKSHQEDQKICHPIVRLVPMDSFILFCCFQ